MAKSDEAGNHRWTLEADSESVVVTFSEEFFDDLESVAFDKRVQRVADAVRNAIYAVTSGTTTRH